MSRVGLRYPNIEAERARRGWTIDELLERIGIKSRKTYYNWCFKGNIPLKSLMKMAEVLDCTPDYLLGFKQSNEN